MLWGPRPEQEVLMPTLTGKALCSYHSTEGRLNSITGRDPMPLDVALIRQMNQRVQEELAKKEMEVVQYWLGEAQRVLDKRHQDLSGMQLDLKALVQKMQNRLKTLKSERVS